MLLWFESEEKLNSRKKKDNNKDVALLNERKRAIIASQRTRARDKGKAEFAVG